MYVEMKSVYLKVLTVSALLCFLNYVECRKHHHNKEEPKQANQDAARMSYSHNEAPAPHPAQQSAPAPGWNVENKPNPPYPSNPNGHAPPYSQQPQAQPQPGYHDNAPAPGGYQQQPGHQTVIVNQPAPSSGVGGLVGGLGAGIVGGVAGAAVFDALKPKDEASSTTTTTAATSTAAAASNVTIVTPSPMNVTSEAPLASYPNTTMDNHATSTTVVDTNTTSSTEMDSSSSTTTGSTTMSTPMAPVEPEIVATKRDLISQAIPQQNTTEIPTTTTEAMPTTTVKPKNNGIALKFTSLFLIPTFCIFLAS